MIEGRHHRCVSTVVLAFILLCLPVSDKSKAEGDTLVMEYAKFRLLPYSERRQLIRRLPPTAQLTAYLDMLDESEPPDLELAEIIAPSGRALVEAVRDRLELGESDLRILDMAHLLFMINKLGHAVVRDEGDVLEVLEHRISCIRDQRRREGGLAVLRRLR